ncbi:MAG: DUF2922 domain-containing protein [Romboutsia sp.]|uniref:DUF2922 domain-containing protein n=1 Tax=Romboutsia sp. TaxID=1965302 RepID=UPI003F3AF1F3
MASIMKTRLLMTFKDEDAKRISLTVDEPRTDLTEVEIKEAMDLVVSKNIFAPNGLSIVGAVEAKIIVTDTTEYDLI